MNKRVLIVAVLALSAMVLSGFVAAQSKDVLNPGQYTAKVKAIGCSGCGPLIQKTLAHHKQLEAISVDQKNSTVQFTVKKGTTVKLSDLQKSLDTAANQLQMGADYTLSDVKPK